MAFHSGRDNNFIVKAGDVVIVETANGVRLPFAVGQAGDSSLPLAVVSVDEDEGGHYSTSPEVIEEEVLPAGGYLMLVDVVDLA